MGLSHTGFAYDGYTYTNGVKGLSLASWATEAQSTDRGPLSSFPTEALILVSRAAVSITDATTEALNLWMLFYLADSYGNSDNAQAIAAGYLASGATWSNGVLVVTMTPDAGSAFPTPKLLVFNFVADTIYSDTYVA